VPDCSEYPILARRLERFRSDLRRRNRQPTGTSRSRPGRIATNAKRTAHATLRSVPPEIGILLLVIGTAGVLLPGPVGSPFLVAGGIALWPAGFRKVEQWLMNVAPGLHETGVRQMEQFLADLERRYPGSLR
jgi:hypothetical protein